MPEEQDIPKQPSNERESADVIMQASPISPSETQPTDMEVHHHPDLHHKPKKWKEYFLEFLMIFLAVTLGFLPRISGNILLIRTIPKYTWKLIAMN
jgi:hypothetical protein